MSVSIDKLNEWLQTKGLERQQAAEEAANTILSIYRSHNGWLYMIPIELNRLAATLNAKIISLNNKESEAMLIPIKGGFRIYINEQIYFKRRRTSIAHELAHILFYDTQTEVPKRLKAPDKKEEVFCFDVARRLLVPDWHLKIIGLSNHSDPQYIFNSLTENFKLSRDIAARIMLQDYSLVKGIAGRWIKNESSWQLQKGKFYTNPSLNKTERKFMSEIAHQFLENKVISNNNYKVLYFSEKQDQGCFLIVYESNSPESGACALSSPGSHH